MSGQGKVINKFLFLVAVAVIFPIHAQEPVQQAGKPLNLEQVDLELVYSNDFSGDDRVVREEDFVEAGKRTGLPDPAAEWIAEGWGGSEVCDGKLHVAPVAFESCGKPAQEGRDNPSHMVVWNKNRFPADMLFEFTVNHHGSDDGLTLVFFAAEGVEGQDLFDLGLPPRNGVYRNYNKGQLKNYTVSYWSRNRKPSLVARGEAFTNRIRKNPGANVLATHASQTSECSDCDYHVRILKAGGEIAVEINGVVVNRVKDNDPLGGGYIGLRNMQGVKLVSYEDFRVWSAQRSESGPPSVGKTHIAGSESEFVAAVETARPGDEIVVRAGTYKDWSVDVEVNGAANGRINIRPESEGAVIFSGRVTEPMFRLRGGHFDFSGFVFEDMELDDGLVIFEATRKARFVDNHIGRIEGRNRIGRAVMLVGGGEDNEFANNRFHDSENFMAITVRLDKTGISQRSLIHHNVFENLNLNRGGEGTTTVQLASSGRLAYEQLLMQAIVEHNYFGNISGDAETISNKSNANIIRNNTFINTKSLVIRQGHNVVVEDNVLVGTTGPAIRVYGSGHTVRGNTIRNPGGDGIALNYGMGSGHEASTHRVTTTNGRFIDNLIENAGANGINLGFGKGTDYTGHKNEKTWNTGVLQNIPPSGNVITGNVITGSKLAAIETAGATENTIVEMVFSDPGAGDWKERWFLEGLKATVEYEKGGLVFSSGPVPMEQASHAVLWTNQSFKGDIRIEYDYTRLDSMTTSTAVNILYIQATGLGTEDSPTDIFLSTNQREVPWMKSYYLNMNALHISYATTGPKRANYVAARRYPAENQESFMQGTMIQPVYENVDLFRPGETYHVTVLKEDGILSFTAEREGGVHTFEWDTSAFPPVTEGRIGLRHMWARSSRYQNIRVFEKMPTE
jgi:hypothetical protein